jgi:hypothetical protein
VQQLSVVARTGIGLEWKVFRAATTKRQTLFFTV